MSGDRKAGPGEFNCFCGQVHPLSMLGRSHAHPAPKPDPVARPDLDTLIAAAHRDINDANRCQTMGIMPATHQLHRRLREVTAALAGERARADQAEQRIAEALVKLDEIDVYQYEVGSAHVGQVKRILSAAPTAEQK